MTIKSSPSFDLERDFSYWQILSLVCSLKYYVHIFVIFSGGLAKIFVQGVSTRAKTLRITFLAASRYIKRENLSLPVDYTTGRQKEEDGDGSENVIRDFKTPRRRRQRERQKSNRLNRQNNNAVHVRHAFL